ncbi:hypothetical protein [Bosea sp. TAF32]|uniref:hypothetical protein n=1 Tax=Bosea sp. TAF32 TaxID=3237482 RepID=UPI003F8DC7DC
MTVTTGWLRTIDDHGCRVVFVEPDRPRAGWMCCWRSRADAETGEIVRAVLLREDEFARRVVDRIEPGGGDGR